MTQGLSSPTTDIDLRATFAILWRRRRVVLATMAVVLGAALGLVLVSTPIYRATTLLLVDSRGANLLDGGEGMSEQSAVLNSRVDGEVEILRSEATRLAVVEAGDLVTDRQFRPALGLFDRFALVIGWPDLAADLRALLGLAPAERHRAGALVARVLEDLRDATDIRRSGMTYVIAISVALPDPDRAADIANLYAQVYLRRQVEAKTRATIEATRALQRQIDAARALMVASDTAMNRYLEDNLAQIEADSADPDVRALRTHLDALRADREQNGAIVRNAQTALDSGNLTVVADTLGDAALRELERQRQEIQRRLNTTLVGSEDAINLAERLSDLERSLVASSNDRIALLRLSMSQTGTDETTARDALRSTLLQSEGSSDLLADLYNLQQNAAITRTQFQTLLSRAQDFDTRANLQLADARVVSEALPPGDPETPGVTRILGGGLIGGLIAGILIAMGLEYSVGGITSAHQLTNVTQWQVPTSVPRIHDPGPNDPADLILTAPLSPFAEAFRTLRAALDRTPRTEATVTAAHTILITSAVMGEGKSTAAIALARTYALAGKRTLLIDADLRKPSIRDRLHLNCIFGIYEYLALVDENKGLGLQAERESKSPLDILATGQGTTVPTDILINSQNFRDLIEDASSIYDVIVIDSPPLLPLVDARYIADTVQKIILLTQFSTTPQKFVRDAVSILEDWKASNTICLSLLSHDDAQNTAPYELARPESPLKHS